MKFEEVTVVCVFIGVCVITFIIMFFIMRSYKKGPTVYIDYSKKEDDKVMASPKPPSSCGFRENYSNISFEPKEFLIHNHLLKNIRIYAENEKGKKVHISDIAYRANGNINMDIAKQAFINKNKIIVYTLEHGLTPVKPLVEHFFGEYAFKIPDGTMPKGFHIGMITSKSIGSHYDETVAPVGAVGGRSVVYIHNNTNDTLKLNHNIIIPPNNKIKYHGEYFIGVALGTVFKDTSNRSIFPDFIYKVPATDIIYGVTSDVSFGNYAGFDYEEDGLLNIPHEPNFLLEEGFMGGPAIGSIDPDYIPLEGFPLSTPVDRWGRPITNKQEIKDWPYADNRKPITLEGNFYIV